MKKLALAIFLIAWCFLSWSGAAFAYQNKALILEDEAHPAGPGANPPAAIANLLGHFNLPYEIKNIDAYVQGDVDRYRVTFYVGETWDNPLPADFLADVLTTNSRVVWLNYNLWQIAWGSSQQDFEDRFGFSYEQARPTGNYTSVIYDGREYSRTQEDFAQLTILDAGKAVTPASLTGGVTTFPYVINSGNFWFVADNPVSEYGGDSSYLVWCDLMHDMVGIEHPAEHQALVRIEDVDAYEDPARLRAIADYLYSQGVPFSLAVIPRFADPLGAWGPPGVIDIDTRPELVSALQYAISKGGTLVMHGFTHQYGNVPNPTNGVSGMDYEFYIVSADAQGNETYVSPVPEDSESWVQSRIDGGRTIFQRAVLPQPQIWETPHYLASDLDYGVFASNMDVIYQRFDNFYPYPLQRTVHGSRLLPENLGYISPPGLTAQMVVDLADRNLGIRDGYASFFFHSEVDISNLQAAVAGIEALGYTFVGPASLTWDPAPDDTAPVIGTVTPAGDIGDAQTQVSVAYSDTGSGVDTAAVQVELDGAPLAGCDVTDTSASCLVTDLQPGLYAISGTVPDLSGNWTTFAGSFTVVDAVAPLVAYESPGGALNTGDVIVSASYTDAAPSSGIAGASVSLNLGAPLPCDVNGGLVDCPLSGLTDGSYDAVVTVTDNSGNEATGSGSFLVDTIGPDVINFSPQSAMHVIDFLMVANFFEEGAGIDTGSVQVLLDDAVTECFASTTYLECPVAGIAEGPHTVRVQVSDLAGNMTVENYAFDVVICSGASPGLAMSLEGIYWASFSDYITRNLSADFLITNSSGPDAHEVTVTDVRSTNGAVARGIPGPADIPAGGNMLLTIRYSVPPGIGSFQTHLSLSAQDACGTSFAYGN